MSELISIREFLTDEEIAAEKEQNIKIREQKLQEDIEWSIALWEQETCYGRVKGNHYMRKVINWGNIRSSEYIRSPRVWCEDYSIKCEFCEIAGILVKPETHEVVNRWKQRGERSD